MKKYLLGPSAVRKLDAVIRGKGEVSSSPLAGAGVTDERDFEAPYTVRWAQSENSGSGAWLIWLPSETLLMVGSAAVDPSAELTAAQDYPEGWFVLDMLSSSSGGDIYLNVHQPKEGDPTANFADEPDTPKDDETVTPILVATASVDLSTGERQVNQFVSSTVTIGVGDAKNKKDVGCYYITRTPPEDPEEPESEGSVGFGNCYVQLAGKLYEGPSSSFAGSAVKSKLLAIVADVSSASGDTTFQFQTYDSLEALKEAQEDQDHLVIPLYKFDDDGCVECDFRTVPYEWQMNYT